MGYLIEFDCPAHGRMCWDAGCDSRKEAEKAYRNKVILLEITPEFRREMNRILSTVAISREPSMIEVFVHRLLSIAEHSEPIEWGSEVSSWVPEIKMKGKS